MQDGEVAAGSDLCFDVRQEAAPDFLEGSGVCTRLGVTLTTELHTNRTVTADEVAINLDAHGSHD